jgi:hypothetical protein
VSSVDILVQPIVKITQPAHRPFTAPGSPDLIGAGVGVMNLAEIPQWSPGRPGCVQATPAHDDSHAIIDARWAADAVGG